MGSLLNYKELSRILAGNETSIRRNSIPKKYELKVSVAQWVIDKLEEWLRM